jgi:sulfur carrier protein
MTVSAEAKTESLTLIVNGETCDVAAATLAEALDVLGYAGLRVATAINGSFVAQRDRALTVLTAGDQVEIVAPRQGG